MTRTRTRALTLLALITSSLATSIPPTRAATVVVTKDVHFGDHGQTLDVYRLASAGEARPVLIALHGGAWRVGDKADWRPPATALAEAGFVVVVANYRLVKNGTNIFPAQLTDVDQAADWVTEHVDDYGGDHTRLGMMGSSAGAHLALLHAFQAGNGEVDAVASWSAPIDLWDFKGTILQPDVKKLLGCTSRCRAAMREASPSTYVSVEAPPTYLANSRREIIPLRQPVRLRDALEELGVGTKLRLVRGRTHGLKLAGKVLASTTEFLKQELSAIASH